MGRSSSKPCLERTLEEANLRSALEAMTPLHPPFHLRSPNSKATQTSKTRFPLETIAPLLLLHLLQAELNSQPQTNLHSSLMIRYRHLPPLALQEGASQDPLATTPSGVFRA